MGQVLSIYIAREKGKPMVELPAMQAVVGKGLMIGPVVDRYAAGVGAWSGVRVGETIRHVTLFSREDLEAANATLPNPFLPEETRRNIYVEGIDLVSLIGQEFFVDGVVMRGVEECTPCGRPSTLAKKPGFEQAFAKRAGIRAEVLCSGTISPGDIVTPALYLTPREIIAAAKQLKRNQRFTAYLRGDGYTYQEIDGIAWSLNQLGYGTTVIRGCYTCDDHRDHPAPHRIIVSDDAIKV